MVWDHLFTEGSIALLKAGLVILDMCESMILSAKDFRKQNIKKILVLQLQIHKTIFLPWMVEIQLIFIILILVAEIIEIVDDFSANRIKEPVSFNKKINEIYINKFLLTRIKEIHREQQDSHLTLQKEKSKARPVNQKNLERI